MFGHKFDMTLNKLYEDISSEIPDAEEISNDIKNDPKKYLKSVLESQNLNDFLTKYIENTEDSDADLSLFAVTLSQMINKSKEESE